MRLIALLAFFSGSLVYAQGRIQFITVDKDVRLEVVDWGGTGRPVVLLAGLGSNAHVFDKFAPKLAGMYHVYGITRRGFGASSVPATGYSADRLGDDILTVFDALRLNRPVLVGHSIAGEELSSIGSRHPERVAGLVYLDAGYGYAYYNVERGDSNVDASESLRKQQASSLRVADPGAQIMAGMQKYTAIHGPVLAIFAIPHDQGKGAATDAADEAVNGAQATAFEKGVPSARVVRIPHANHSVFISNEADVLHEMNAFISTLP